MFAHFSNFNELYPKQHLNIKINEASPMLKK